MPHERRHAVQGAGCSRELPQRSAELAFPVDGVLVPQPMEQRVVLDRQRHSLVGVLPEPAVYGAGVAPTERQV
jgi:hypothetical protein